MILCKRLGRAPWAMWEHGEMANDPDPCVDRAAVLRSQTLTEDPHRRLIHEVEEGGARYIALAQTIREREPAAELLSRFNPVNAVAVEELDLLEK